MKSTKELYSNEECPATILNMALERDTGGGHLLWEPETIWLHLKKIHNVRPSRTNKDKILAIIGALTTNQFYIYWEALENIGKALNSQKVSFLGLTPLSPEELVWAILEVKLNETNDDDFFSSDVESYIETVFKTNGVSTVPLYLEGISKYKTYYNYNKKVEKIKQYRIKMWCDLKFNKIIELAKEYFDINLTNEIKSICPDFTVLS
jgi:hypothetical protein